MDLTWLSTLKVKNRVIPVLSSANWESGGAVPHIFTSTLNGGGWSFSCFSCFATAWLLYKSLDGLRADADVADKQKIMLLVPEIELRFVKHPVCSCLSCAYVK